MHFSLRKRLFELREISLSYEKKKNGALLQVMFSPLNLSLTFQTKLVLEVIISSIIMFAYVNSAVFLPLYFPNVWSCLLQWSQ